MFPVRFWDGLIKFRLHGLNINQDSFKFIADIVLAAGAIAEILFDHTWAYLAGFIQSFVLIEEAPLADD